jgi:hypothetical protein
MRLYRSKRSVESMRHRSSLTRSLVLCTGLLASSVLLLLLLGSSTHAQAPLDKPQPPPKAANPLTSQTIYGFPLTITVEDSGQMDIRYRDPSENQFYGDDAEGVYLWVNVAGVTTVFGPASVPAGNNANPYTPLSNVLTGSGTPADPWRITTVNDVPGTNLRLIQNTSYVNGAEFTNMRFAVQQIGGTQPVTATLFHAADLYTAGNDQGYGYYDPSSGGVGDYITQTNGSVLYQQFVPAGTIPPTAYQESYYSTIWDQIGSTTGPGPGFDNTIISDTLHDAGAGLQWNLTIPPNGAVEVADDDLFSPHASICGSFSDVPYGSPYYDYVYYLVCHDIVNGYPDTTFRPNNNTTRGQISKIVSNSAGYSETIPSTVQTFEDVPNTNTFWLYVERVYAHGVLSGYPCGGPLEPCIPPGNRPYFRPNNNVTRGQISKIVANAAGFNEVVPSTQQTFEDVLPGDTFWVYIERMASRGIINGYPCGGPGEPCIGPTNRPYFRVGNSATRGQVSKIDKISFFGP